MKTKTLAILAVACMLASCQKEIKLHVKQIHETEKNDLWEIDVQRPVFSTTETSVEKSCVIINDSITNFITQQQDSLKVQARELKTSLDAAGLSMAGVCSFYVRDSVFMADEDYISVRLLTYTFTGGAHGMTNFYGLNYNVKTMRFLDPKEIIDYSKADQINELLKTHFQNPDSCFSQIPTIENLTTVNVTLHTVDFTYAQYVLGAYACGYTTVAIPRNKMNDLLLIKK